MGDGLEGPNTVAANGRRTIGFGNNARRGGDGDSMTDPGILIRASSIKVVTGSTWAVTFDKASR